MRTWHEGFDYLRTCLFRKRDLLVLKTGKPLPTKPELLAAAFTFGLDGVAHWVPPTVFRSSASDGFS